MAGRCEKRRNRDGTVSWRVVVIVGYGRNARKVTRVACRTERDQEKPPPKAAKLLRDLERQAELLSAETEAAFRVLPEAVSPRSVAQLGEPGS